MFVTMMCLLCHAIFSLYIFSLLQTVLQVPHVQFVPTVLYTLVLPWLALLRVGHTLSPT